MILDLRSPAGLAEINAPLATPFSSENWVRLKYFHFPDLPLTDSFVDAVTVGSTSWPMPAVSSIQELVNMLDSLLYDSGAGLDRVVHAFYDGHTLEVCPVKSMTLSTDFATFLKLGENLLSGECYETALFEERLSVFSHFNVTVKNVRGSWNGTTHDEVIARILRDGEIISHRHYFRGPVRQLEVAVNSVRKDGTMAEHYTNEIFALGIEYE